ncbi:uncharacterized protein LOC136078126 [Hydra vulgaris]|uniref:Uncharacterized protein LOC136078126 n=1 Tax=Hydra vulgaris TaxID=6087 RepID=A0ABM4BJF2_HYDVU
MLIEAFILRLAVILMTSFFQDSILENTIPTYSLGYFGSLVFSANPANDSTCVQSCWNKIESGELYEGAVINNDYQNCFCTVTQVGLRLLIGGNRKNINFLFSIFKPELASCSIGSYINFRVRISFYLEGDDESKLYFIDDLNNAMSYSGRIIITRFINLGRSFHTSISTERNSQSKLYSLVKETYSGNLNSKFENFYALETKIGDMSLADIHKEWAVLVYSTSKSLWVTLTPFTIQRPVKKCSLIIAVSNYTLNQSMFINFNMTTSADCVVDLENVTIIVEHNPRFKLKRLTWDNLSINPTSVINHSNFNLIYVQKIYIDSFLKFSVEYEIDTIPLEFGQEIISVIASIHCNGFTDDKPVKFFKLMAFNKILELLTQKATIQVYLKLNMKNKTKFENKTHLCECMSIIKRQQSPCFQLEKSTGKAIYFPIHVLEVIGYDPLTNFLYGKTFRENIIQVDIHGKKPAVIITEDKWLSVSSSSSFQIKN